MARGGKRPGAGRKAGSGGKGTEQEKPEFLPKPGRPSEYDPSYCSDIVDFCRQGYSLTAFAGAIGVARRTITEWAATHPEFSLAVLAAKAASAFWWEQKGRRVAERGGGPGTATMIMFSLKNLSPEDFREKVDHTLGNADDKPFRTQNETTLRADLTVEQLRILENILAPPAEPR